jgi:pyruvate dehydrogenase E1 component alpha subunit
MDVLAVRKCGPTRCRLRGEGKPFLLVAETYRFRAHSMYDPELYRSKEEVEEWKKRCPVANFGSSLRDEGYINESNLAEIEGQISKEIDEAIAFAAAGDLEPVEDLLKDVYTPMK